MRLFIGIDLDSKIKEELSKIIENLKKIKLDAKWVKKENLHLSLKFLGEVSEDKLEKIKEIILKVSKNLNPIEISTQNFGFFPNQNYPRVFFIGTDKEEELKKVASSLEDELEKIGFEKEDRFKSHITLARFRSLKNIDLLKKELKNIDISLRFNFTEICLFKSTLTSDSPIYEVIFKKELNII